MTTQSYTARMFRRIQGLLQLGTTSAAPVDTGPVQTVQVKLNAMTTRDAMPVVQHFGFSAVLPLGSDVVVLNVSGDASNGTIIGSVHQESRPKGLEPGQSCLFDQAGNQILLTNGQGITITPQSGQPIILNGPTTIDGALTVTGDATIGGVDFLKHVHGNVQNGGGTTAAPTS